MLQEYDKALQYCTYCPKLCRHTCPVGNAEARESVITQAKMAMANYMRKGIVDCTSEYTSVFYHCNGCGLCTEFCMHDIPVTHTLFAARAVAVERGAEPQMLRQYPERFYRRNTELLHQLHKLVDERYFVEEAQVAYMPGCDLIERCPDDVGRTLKLLEACGIDYVAMMESELVCGGYPLWAAGYPAEFRHLASELASVLSRYKRIICACPSCTYAMRNLYPQMGITLTAEVLHITEFLDTIAHRIPVRKTFPSAFYHDPCYLGRYLGVFDPPRRLMGLAVRQVLEFSQNRSNSYCCGAGGLLPETVSDAAQAIAVKRLEEVYESETSMVVTACATCVNNLRRNASSLEVMDIISLLYSAL